MSNSLTTQWTATHQAPLSMGFPSKNTGVDWHFLLQGIFLTQGSNQCLLCWQAESLPLSDLGSPELPVSLYYHLKLHDSAVFTQLKIKTTVNIIKILLVIPFLENWYLNFVKADTLKLFFDKLWKNPETAMFLQSRQQ